MKEQIKVFAVILLLAVLFLIGHFVLLRRQRFGMIFSQTFRSSGDRLRIFCMILTTAENLESKAVYIQQSWAYKCDKHKFITVIPELLVKQDLGAREKWKKNETIELNFLSEYSPDLGRKNYSNKSEEMLTTTLPLLQPAGLQTDKYQLLTEKMSLTISYISKIYGDYDWYLKADDDTMIFVDNLREFLADKDSSGNFTYGYHYKVLVKTGYHSGGAGYVLPRQAVLDMGLKLSKDPRLLGTGFIEDANVAEFLRTLGYIAGSSLDEKQRERFHPLSLEHFYYGNFQDWLFKYSKNQVKNGSECCSDSSISFHYTTPKELMIMGDLLRSSTKKPTFKDIAVAIGIEWQDDKANLTAS